MFSNVHVDVQICIKCKSWTTPGLHRGVEGVLICMQGHLVWVCLNCSTHLKHFPVHYNTLFWPFMLIYRLSCWLTMTFADCHWLMLMLMLILWLLEVTPGSTYVWAYHRPSDGHFSSARSYLNYSVPLWVQQQQFFEISTHIIYRAKQSLQIPTTWSTIRATHAIHVLVQHTNKCHNPTNKCSNAQKRRMPFSPLTIHECLPSSWFADSHWPLNSLTIILWFASSPFTIELVPHLANFEGCSLGGRCIHPLLQEEWNICWRPLACSHNYCSCLFCHLAVVDHCGRLLHVVGRGVTLDNLLLGPLDPPLEAPAN